MSDVFLGLGAAEWQAVRLSLKVALVASVLSLPFALFVSYALARWEFRGKQLLNAAVHLPLILPPVVTGYLLLLSFGPQTAVGSFLDSMGLGLAFRWGGAALAAGIMGFPLMVRAIRLSIENVDPRFEMAAATLGSNRFAVFWRITLPLARSGILTGLVLGFAKALGEFGATITFVSNIPGETRTIPSAIYSFLQVPGGEASALKLVIVSIVLAFGALFASEVLARRGATKYQRQT